VLTLKERVETGTTTLDRCPLLRAIRLDTSKVTQDRLNIEDKVRSNLFPWNGQFSPQLVHAFLETYAAPDDFVLDPFMGSGTVLVEAGRLGLRAFGGEINPAAYTMSQTYRFINHDRSARRSVLDNVGHAVDKAFGSLPLFSKGHGASSPDVKTRLLDLYKAQSGADACCLVETLVVLLDFYKGAPTNENVLATWEKLRRTVSDLPLSKRTIDMANCDARSMPLEGGLVDLVVTSPPYINVFNYHQQYRASMEALGWDLLHVARSEVGSNRKHRQNRLLTVTQYCLDMADVLRELARVCKRSARIILVMGRESNVRKTRFYNGEIVARIGVRCLGLKAEKRQERVFKNKFGALIYEDILHFRLPPRIGKGESPTAIAEETLRAAMEYAPQESMEDLKDALDRVGEVKPSPIYAPQPE
jgi:hypothetical protein